MLDIERAGTLLQQAVKPLPAEEVPLERGAGLILAEDLLAGDPLPAADISAMDGYAVLHADLSSGQALPVGAEIPAGVAPGPHRPGTATRIFTGAGLPDGADTVVPQEAAKSLTDGRVHLEAREKGANVRHQGELFHTGSVLARAGSQLTPQRLALLAAAGVSRVQVHPAPGVAILVTGRELVEIDAQPEEGQIRDSNGPMLAALAEQEGLSLRSRERATDERAALRAGLERALAGAELVLTSGGVSVGDYDLVPELLRELGGDVLFHGLAIKPGKPALVARVGERWVLGLPGNPLAGLVVWRLVGRPLARTLGGHRGELPPAGRTARVEEALANEGPRTLLRMAAMSVGADGELVQVLPWSGSHDLVAGAGANALLRLDPGERIEPGGRARVYPL